MRCKIPARHRHGFGKDWDILGLTIRKSYLAFKIMLVIRPYNDSARKTGRLNFKPNTSAHEPEAATDVLCLKI